MYISVLFVAIVALIGLTFSEGRSGRVFALGLLALAAVACMGLTVLELSRPETMQANTERRVK